MNLKLNTLTANKIIRICGQCGNFITNLIPRAKVPCHLSTRCKIYVHVEKIKYICTLNVMRDPCGKLPTIAVGAPDLFYERNAHSGFDYSGPNWWD